MSSETPPLPNEAPPRAAEEAATEPRQANQPVEEPSSTPSETEKQAPPPATATAAAGEAGGPMIPAMPADSGEDDFDDEEIPEEEDFEAAFRAEPEPDDDQGPIQGVVVTVRDDGAFVDVGRKSEAFLPFVVRKGEERPELNTGDTVEVMISGRSPEGYLLLSGLQALRPAQWRDLEAAYGAGAVILGKVSEVVKGGLAVDVGVRGFLPASRSGERDQEAVAALVGREIRCKIVQLDVEDRNVVLDRRAVLEEERAMRRQEAVAGLRVGDVVRGVVRTIRDFGAFVDLGGVDALLHVSDIAWARVDDVSSKVSEGDEIEVKVLKVEQDGERISVGLKQLQRDPWTLIAEELNVGDRTRGRVTRLKEFGAFVELTPGVEGLIHISEMSWSRRVRRPQDVVQEGDEVEVVVLDMNLASRRIGLGLKQALGDPWDRFEKEHAVGSTLDGVVRNLTKFGAFVEVEEGVEGLLHVSDITSEKRLDHPREVLKPEQKVRVKLLEIDRGKKRLKLGMKQLEPSDQDRFLETAKVGDTVSGRVLSVRGAEAVIELGEGVRGVCRIELAKAAESKAAARPAGADVSSLSAMLEQAWKGGAEGEASGDAAFAPGQLRSFRVAQVDAEAGKIELTLA